MPTFISKPKTITATRITAQVIEKNGALKPDAPKDRAFFTDETGTEIMGQKGDWLVTTESGHIVIITNEDLKANFDEAPPPKTKSRYGR